MSDNGKHKIRKCRTMKPLFTIDCWNDGEYVGLQKIKERELRKFNGNMRMFMIR